MPDAPAEGHTHRVEFMNGVITQVSRDSTPLPPAEGVYAMFCETYNAFVAELDNLQQRLSELEGALRAVEWVRTDDWEQTFCTSCGVEFGEEHESDCRTALALRGSDPE